MAEDTEALEVLRRVWRVQGQVPELDEGCETKSCKRMADAGVGFEDFAEDSEHEGGELAEVVDLAAAWRARLRREGKYNASGGSVRDLVMGPRP